jgi:hypothetical protein
MVKDIVIVDLDGTLCDSRHREHLAQNKQWDDFHAKAGHDNPNEDVFQIVRLLSTGVYKPMPNIEGAFGAGFYQVVGVTGRPEKYRGATFAWLERWGVMLDDVLMRPDMNFDPDVIVKPAIFREKYTIERVLFALEDRDVMVDAWRGLGIPCWQVRPSGY